MQEDCQHRPVRHHGNKWLIYINLAEIRELRSLLKMGFKLRLELVLN
jgi:hypothetical protein